MTADLDYCELHLSIKDYFTRSPYVDSSGITTLNLPYESIEWVDQMYETRAQDISTARITLPSLITFPELRPLLQNIKEGNRVELYDFQPDCGQPVFAGFIPPNGISEDDGKTILDVQDTLTQLRWQHIRKYESFNTSAAGFYQRALSIWSDLVNEDFLGTNPAGDYTLHGAAGATYASGYVQCSASSGFVRLVPNVLASGFMILPGSAWLLEADVTASAFASGFSLSAGLGLRAPSTLDPGNTLNGFEGGIFYTNGSGSYPFVEQPYVQYGQPTSTGGTTTPNVTGTGLASLAMPATHHVTVYASFIAPGTLAAYMWFDSQLASYFILPWTFDSTLYTPYLHLQARSPDYVQVTNWRVRQLVPAINQAPRFAPQTTDATSYQPNHEENLQLLQLIAEKDDAEYRPNYKAWPQIDELELDQVGTLGAFPSRTLGYEQPGSSPLIKAPDAAPFAVDADPAYGAYITVPPFRFEEGVNLAEAPKVLAREIAHANEVVRMGASSADAQPFANKWWTPEVGRPQHSGSIGTYPYFEEISNDDRLGIQAIVSRDAQLEVQRRIDPLASYQVTVVQELPFASSKWRAGDWIHTVTRSLRSNLEQELRVVKREVKAGSPQVAVTLGHLDLDPSGLRLLHDDTMISWLYDQSGTSPAVYTLPITGSIASFSSSASMTIPLDQYTTGTAIVYAALHWFADANVMKLQPVVNGQQPSIPTAGVSGTDSGLVVVSQCFSAPGNYTISFTNNDSVSRNLVAAFLVLRIKG